MDFTEMQGREGLDRLLLLLGAVGCDGDSAPRDHVRMRIEQQINHRSSVRQEISYASLDPMHVQE
jgi:hypothetical protein